MSEADLKTGFGYMQEMYFLGLVDGAGREDNKGTGNYPSTRFARIKAAGERALLQYDKLSSSGKARKAANPPGATG